MWLRDPRCPEVVSEAWERGLSFSSGSPIHNCLHSCREALERWNKVEFGHVGRRISALQTNLQQLEQQPELHAANIDLGPDMGEVREFIDLVWYARNVKQWSIQELARFFSVAWGIWSNRNEIRVGGPRKSASGIAG
nr:hypothetical protein CFP56_48120 [Quercus suber]